jgi:O-succinylbenzoic acid--CoA ligase
VGEDGRVRLPRVLPDPGPAQVPALLEALTAALDGSGPALLPVPEGAAGGALLAAALPGEPVEDGVALLLPTSGSTGEAKVVELGAGALVASARATAQRLGGPGRWLLALPLTHVAGWQVLVRSSLAGTDPVVAGSGTAALAAAAAELAGQPAPHRYAALVPTQLVRALDDPAAREALAALDAVLLGGAAAPPAVLARAAAAGVPVVRTYGSSETSGGCVYDGLPLPGVSVRLADGDRVALAGPVLARRYRGRPELTAQVFVEDGGRRWFLTSDVGAVAANGSLQVLGRADDVLVSGGVNVAPAAVEAVVGALAGVAEVVVVGVPDAEWGQRVVALVVAGPDPSGPLPALGQVRSAVADRVGPAAAPTALLRVGALPLRGVGKPDRVASAALAAQLLAGG